MSGVQSFILECVGLYFGGVLASGVTSDLLRGHVFGGVADVAGAIASTLLWFIVITAKYRSEGLGSLWSWGTVPIKQVVLVGSGIGLFLVLRLARISESGFSSFPSEPWLLIPLLINMVALAPLREELFWRAFVFRRMVPFLGTWGSIALSSLLFGLVHRQAWLSSAYAGVVFAWMYSKHGSGSLIMSITLHSLINLTNLFLPR